jgi:hypothetical protein
VPNAAARSQSGACGSLALLDPPPPPSKPRNDEADSNPPILALSFRFRSSDPRISKSSAVSVALSDDDDDDDDDDAESNGSEASSC